MFKNPLILIVERKQKLQNEIDSLSLKITNSLDLNYSDVEHISLIIERNQKKAVVLELDTLFNLLNK
jgi:hypothetical protein